VPGGIDAVVVDSHIHGRILRKPRDQGES